MMELLTTKGYLLLIDEEAEIKTGDIVVHNFGMGYEIEEPCDKDNLKSNTRFKILGYYPLAKEAKGLDLPLLPLVGLETEEGKILKDDGIFVYLQNGKKYKKSELELWVENT